MSRFFLFLSGQPSHAFVSLFLCSRQKIPTPPLASCIFLFIGLFFSRCPFVLAAARWISLVCSGTEAEVAETSDQLKALTASLSSCKGQGESAGNLLRRLLPSLRENLLRAAELAPGKTTPSVSHSKKLSSGASTWPIHWLQEKKAEKLHRRDPDDTRSILSKRQKIKSSSSNAASSSSSSSSVSSSASASSFASSSSGHSAEQSFVPDEEILLQDACLLLSVCTEGLQRRTERDIAEDVKQLRREEAKVSELLTGQGGSGGTGPSAADGESAGGLGCSVIQGWLLDLKEQSERDHACAFCKREFLLDEEILQMQKEVETRVQVNTRKTPPGPCTPSHPS